MRRAAILAGELVTKEHVEPGEGGVPYLRHIFFQRDDRRQLHLERGRADRILIFRNDGDAVEAYGLHRVLPGP